MKNKLFLICITTLLTVLIISCSDNSNPVNENGAVQNTLQKSTLQKGGGFDEFGYNYGARLFNGPADGVDRVLDGLLWGDPTYANDKLNMKWSKAWDDARFNGAPWTPDAWTTNEWNGKVKGGSGEIWHYKIVWVGAELENSPYWRNGGYAIWGQFEVIMSQGTVANEHFWDVHATPTGFGTFK